MKREEPDRTDETFQIHPIGYVANKYDRPASREETCNEESRIILHPRYVDGLYKIEEHRYLDVVFYLDRSAPFDLMNQRVRGGTRGVFASRSPRRPVPLGLTTVELIRVEDNELLVRGLDALNKTPVLDIKPHVDAGAA